MEVSNMKLENGKIYIGFMPEGQYIGVYNKKDDELQALYTLDTSKNAINILPATHPLYLQGPIAMKLLPLSFARTSFQGFQPIDILKHGDDLRAIYMEVTTGIVPAKPGDLTAIQNESGIITKV